MEILEDAHARTSSVFSYFPGVQHKQPIAITASMPTTIVSSRLLLVSSSKGNRSESPLQGSFSKKDGRIWNPRNFPKRSIQSNGARQKINNLLRQIESLVHRAFSVFLFYPICKFLSYKLLSHLERRFCELLPLSDGVNVTRLYSAGRGNCVRPKKAYLHPQCQYCAPQSKRHIHK